MNGLVDRGLELSIFEFIYWDVTSNLTLLADMLLAIVFILCLRLFLGFISHVDTVKELTNKDHPAFGISLAGGTIAVAIVLSGAIFGDPVFEFLDSFVSILTYGIVGIALMGVTRIIFDRLAFPNISIKSLIKDGNVAAGILDAGNMIAASIVIYAVIVWVLDNSLSGVLDVVAGFLMSQVILTAVILTRVKLFGRRYNHTSFSKEIERGNAAIALRFSGRRIGVAFAIAAASDILTYDHYNGYSFLLAWACVALLFILGLSVVSWVAQRVILFGIDVNKVVVADENVAVGTVQAAIYIALGILMMQLVG